MGDVQIIKAVQSIIGHQNDHIAIHGKVFSQESFISHVLINREAPTISWAEVQAKMDELRPQEALKKLREQRDEKLKQTDQYGLADYPFRSDEHKQAWLDYRRNLRDLPINSPNISIDLETGELTGVVWPTEPTILF